MSGPTTKILRPGNLYKQSRFFPTNRNNATDRSSVYPLRCFYPLGSILLHSLVGWRRSFSGQLQKSLRFLCVSAPLPRGIMTFRMICSLRHLYPTGLRALFSVWLWLSSGVLIFGCAASFQVIDVIDLPPPRQVEAERRGGQITIRWQAGSERRHAQFSGYKLFMATHSLATTPVRELPQPYCLPDTATTFSFATTDTARLFIHIRSCAGKSKFSLPSLPEMVVPGKL